MINKRIVRLMKEKYQKGTKVELEYMGSDVHRLPVDTIGKVNYVDDAGTVHVTWETGSTLGIIHGIDKIKPLDNKVNYDKLIEEINEMYCSKYIEEVIDKAKDENLSREALIEFFDESTHIAKSKERLEYFYDREYCNDDDTIYVVELDLWIL